MRTTIFISLVAFFFAGACKKGDDGPAKYVRFTKPELTVNNYEGANDSITIESNTGWKLSVTGTAKDAIQLSQAGGSGNATVKIKLTQEVAANATVSLVLSDSGGRATRANCNVHIYTYTFTTQWSKTFGGSSYDEVNKICLFSPDQFLLSGYTNSQDFDATHHFGVTDGLSLIVDAGGTLKGLRQSGGSDGDEFYAAAPTGDGGFIAVGSTSSKDGEASSHHTLYDAWIVKFNSNYDTVWTRTWGGDSYDRATVIAAAPDGTFLIGGNTKSNNDDFAGSKGQTDGWLMKIDGNGQKQWQEFTRIGGSADDHLTGMVVTGDGACVVAGLSYSSDITGTSHSGGADAYVARVTPGGQIAWQQLVGGNSDDQASAITGFPDGSVVFAGYSRSPRQNGTYQAFQDGWLLKMDNTGTVLWDKNFGTVGAEYLHTLTATSDGGCVAGGQAFGNGRDVTGAKGNNDGWLLKVNSSGQKLWHKVIGGSNNDYISAISQTSNGDLIIAGTTKSTDGDVTGPIKGETDIWITRLKVQ